MPPSDEPVSLSVGVSPSGKVHVSRGDAFARPIAARAARRIEEAFARGSGHGLLLLGAEETTGDLGPTAGYWRDLAKLHLTEVSRLVDLEAEVAAGLEIPLPGAEVERLLAAAPPMLGTEYLSEEVLRTAWKAIGEAFLVEARAAAGGAEAYLHERNPLWRSVGRVFLHLAENRVRPDLPFAFLATYTSRISAHGKLQHVPLGRALREQTASGNKKALLSLLMPLKKAAERSAFLEELVDSGRVFHPQAWTPEDAHRFLRDVPIIEESGIFVRVPDWWNPRSPPRVRVGITVGGSAPAALGTDALLDFAVDLSLEGEAITDEERRRILEGQGSFALVKGRWVEVDRDQLRQVLGHWKTVEEEMGRSGISFIDAMRLLAGMTSVAPAGDASEAGPADPASPWVTVRSGEWLRGILAELRSPEATDTLLPPGFLRDTLRPYQVEGLRWLWLLHRLRLGGCLADDMGLGKTVQVLALLVALRRAAAEVRGDGPGPRASLLVIPASLIGNWKAECARFAPDLRVAVLHPSELDEPLRGPPPGIEETDIVITTYGMLSRLPWLGDIEWRIVALDEAQAIKNPGTRQARAVKSLNALHRLALTGTPVENRLGDLWSLFDFLVPGLLGDAKQFGRLTKGTVGSEVYSRVRALVRPHILRRLKTDRRIIADLPDKEEVKVYCGLRKAQAVLYEASVRELADALRGADGIRRRGVILAFLTRLKQICNHPSQWTGDGSWDPAESGKMARLLEICEEVADRQEKVLAFTQFKEITHPLASALERVFRRPGCILDGDTPVAKRRELVEGFQDEDGPPFFVLSLKAGGTGLNLTAATHVVHFDRWWNPAVENQATDRAYRIGQKRNVLVHKFLCRGTVEENIDGLLESKQAMADEILGGGAEAALTEMGDEELMRFVSMDRKRAFEEG